MTAPRSLFAAWLAVLGCSFAAGQERPAEFKRPRILGVSHVAFYVADMAKTRAFYEGYLGFDVPFTLPRKGSGELVWIKINDRQTIELFPGSEVSPDADRFYHLALEVDDAEAMRVYLRSQGVKVPTVTPIGKIGNKNYFVRDPNGNIVEIVQYLPESWTMREKGRHLPDTRIATRMSHGGIIVGQLDASLKFYRDILGFRETWRGSAGGKLLNWVNLQVPDGRDYIELMLYDKMPSTDRIRTLQHICLEVPDVAKAVEILKSRPLPPGCKPPSEMKIGVNGKRQINCFDPDGTRVEIMEAATASGQPPPPSNAPPPAPLPFPGPPRA